MKEREEYLKLEYNKLNNEILSFSEELRVRERLAITFSPVVGAWIFIQLYDGGFKSSWDFYLSLILCALTFIITFLFGMSVLLIYESILITAKYIQQLEDDFLGETSSLGWEKFYNDPTNNKKRLVKMAVTNWIIYLLLPIIMAIILPFLNKLYCV